MAAFVVVVLGLQMAESIIVPFLLALFLSVISSAPFSWLKRRGVPTSLSMVLVVLSMALLVLGLAVLMSNSLGSFLRAVPQYQTHLSELTAQLVAALESHGINVSTPVVQEYFNPGKLMQFVANALNALSSVLTNALVIFALVIILLVESLDFRARLRAALPHPQPYLDFIDQFNRTIEHYFALRTLMNLITGVAVTLWLLFVGVDFPVLWGLLVFLLNYIPYFGAYIAAVPPVLLALVQLGWGPAALSAAGYALISLVMGNLVEPRAFGQGMGLSMVVVFLSLAFWGWVLGPVGMLLSVPLTMVLKIALESKEDTRWMAILIGDTPQSE